MFAITSTAMLAIIGLLYTFALVLSQRRSVQTAADAASLGGSWQVLVELASDNRSDANVLNVITRYSASNGIAAANVSAVYVDATGVQLLAVGSGGQFPIGARGIRVTTTGDVPTFLPGFVNVPDVLVRDSATAAARATVPPSSAPVIPLGVSASAYAAHATFDLFANHAPTLDFNSSGAPTYGPTSTNEQYWSDGQHLGSWQLHQPGTVNLADAAYYTSIAAGLKDNVRRQSLPPDVNGNTYALVYAPVYDTASASSVHVVGFVQLKIVSSTISDTSLPVLFVPYAVAAFGTPQTPSPDLGATLVGIIS